MPDAPSGDTGEPEPEADRRSVSWDTAPVEDPAVMNAILDILFRKRSQRPAA